MPFLKYKKKSNLIHLRSFAKRLRVNKKPGCNVSYTDSVNSSIYNLFYETYPIVEFNSPATAYSKLHKDQYRNCVK